MERHRRVEVFRPPRGADYARAGLGLRQGQQVKGHSVEVPVDDR